MPAEDNRVLELAVSVADGVESHERRDGVEIPRDPRMPLGLWAQVQVDGMISEQALGDLSASGLYLRMTTAPRVGARVRIVLGLPYISGERVCSLAGTIVRVDRRGHEVRGAGVKFDEQMENADHELLKGFLSLWGVPSAPKTGGEAD